MQRHIIIILTSTIYSNVGSGISRPIKGLDDVHYAALLHFCLDKNAQTGIETVGHTGTVITDITDEMKSTNN